MITLTWVDSEIEKAMSEGATARNIHDLAALLIVRNYLQERAAPETVEPVAISDTLDSVPTIDQIEAAIGTLSANTPEEQQRLRDAHTWAKIIRGS